MAKRKDRHPAAVLFETGPRLPWEYDVAPLLAIPSDWYASAWNPQRLALATALREGWLQPEPQGAAAAATERWQAWCFANVHPPLLARRTPHDPYGRIHLQFFPYLRVGEGPAPPPCWIPGNRLFELKAIAGRYDASEYGVSFRDGGPDDAFSGVEFRLPPGHLDDASRHLLDWCVEAVEWDMESPLVRPYGHPIRRPVAV